MFGVLILFGISLSLGVKVRINHLNTMTDHMPAVGTTE